MRRLYLLLTRRKTMRKHVLSSLALGAFLFFGAATVMADNTQVVGAWNMELDFQGQPFLLDLVITESADGLAGTLGAPEFGVNPVSNVAFDGETLKFDADDQQGGKVTIALKLADSKLSGTIVSPMGDIPAKASKKI
jgi:hypothetical protein